MVDDDHIRLRRLFPRLEQEAPLVRWAARPLAQIRFGGDFIPHFRTRCGCEIAQRSVARTLGPRLNGVELLLKSVVEQGVARCARLLESHEAQKIAPSFEEREANRLVGERAGEERQVFANELFLQVDRVRRHDRALTVCGRPAKRRHEIAERFADTRAGFEQPDAAFVVKPRDLDGHRALAGTILVARVLLRDRAAGAEVTVDARKIDRPMRGALRHLDDDIQRRRGVVDDGEPDAVVVQPRGDIEVRLRGVEKSRRMIVDEHLALLGESRQREHAA